MSLRRIGAVAVAHVRELWRRKLALLLLIGLPMAFYFAAFNPRIAISFATVGFGWSVAIVSLFSTQAMTAITPRLALIGFRPAEMVLGRILSIAFYATVIGTALYAYLLTDDVVIDDGHLLASLGFAVLGSATAGLAVGAVLEREMEAMLILIALVSLTLVVDWDSTLAKVLPMYATDRHAWGAVDGFVGGSTAPWRWTASTAGVLAGVAIVATLIKVPRIERSGS